MNGWGVKRFWKMGWGSRACLEDEWLGSRAFLEDEWLGSKTFLEDGLGE